MAVSSGFINLLDALNGWSLLNCIYLTVLYNKTCLIWAAVLRGHLSLSITHFVCTSEVLTSDYSYWFINGSAPSFYSFLSHIGAPVAQWFKCWPTDMVPSSSCARGEIFSTANRIPLQAAFHYQLPIVLICLKYCWKGHKIASHPSIIHPSIPYNLGRLPGHHKWICNNPFPSCPVSSCPSPSLSTLFIVFNFFWLPLLLFLFTMPCRIVLAKPEDLEMWPNHLSYHLIRVIRLIAFCSISSQMPAFLSLALQSRSMIHRHTEIWKWQESASASPLIHEICCYLSKLISAL